MSAKSEVQPFLSENTGITRRAFLRNGGRVIGGAILAATVINEGSLTRDQRAIDARISDLEEMSKDTVAVSPTDVEKEKIKAYEDNNIAERSELSRKGLISAVVIFAATEGDKFLESIQKQRSETIGVENPHSPTE